MSGLGFEFNDDDFQYMKQLAKNLTGIELADNKKHMLYGRLVHILRTANIKNFSQYCDQLKSGQEEFIHEFVNAITTNLTFFFRENHHFELLKDRIPNLLRNSSDKCVRIWSAGCSTGEEPYSIAFTIYPFVNLARGYEFKILATDLDSQVLQKAKSGLYEGSQVKQHLSSEQIKTWFDMHGENFKVRSEYQKLITFNQLNLFDVWPMKFKFDVIFCRNVLIYFDKPTQEELIFQFESQLKLGGYLLLGHSESLGKKAKFMKSLGKSCYQKMSQ